MNNHRVAIPVYHNRAKVFITEAVVVVVSVNHTTEPLSLDNNLKFSAT